MKATKIWVLPFLIFFCTLLHGQTNKVINSTFCSWWTVNNKYHVNSNLYFGSEVHIRRANFLKHWQQFLVRPSINYKFSKDYDVGIGYTFLYNYPYGAQPIAINAPEHNVWEQIVLHHKAGQIKLSHRLRLEQRFIGNIVTPDETHLAPYLDGFTYANRFRYRLTGKFPIAIQGKFFGKFFNEIWLHLEDYMLPESLNQNWLYLGLGYSFCDRGNVQIGFMDQLIQKSDHIHYENNPVLQVSVGYTFGRFKSQ